jgi:hypothetical protein
MAPSEDTIAIAIKEVEEVEFLGREKHFAARARDFGTFPVDLEILELEEPFVSRVGTKVSLDSGYQFSRGERLGNVVVCA